MSGKLADDSDVGFCVAIRYCCTCVLNHATCQDEEEHGGSGGGGEG